MEDGGTGGDEGGKWWCDERAVLQEAGDEDRKWWCDERAVLQEGHDALKVLQAAARRWESDGGPKPMGGRGNRARKGVACAMKASHTTGRLLAASLQLGGSSLASPRKLETGRAWMPARRE
eukprot:349882-Chlamydomonas_euryale.AAC.2